MIDAPLHSALSCSGSTGDTCTLQCDEGYAVKGSDTLTCGEDHVWRGSGTCEAVDGCTVDNGGCSVRQRQLLGGTETGSSSHIGLNAGKLSDILLEVAVGGIVTAAVNYAWRHGPRALRL